MTEKLMGVSSPSNEPSQAALRPGAGDGREYFPKRTDLSVHGPDILKAVEDRLNNRPCKTLGWRTPARAFETVLR